MNDINPTQIESMAAIMAALSNAEEGISPAQSPLRESTKIDDSNMGAILDAFRTATDNVLSEAMDESGHSVEFQRALETERMDTGVRVGSWKITIRNVDGFGNYYDVAHNLTNEPIASDLRLYEAALALVNSLNDGETFTSGSIKAIIDLERDYARALSDAVSFASRMKITEGAQHDIAEARYSESRRQALVAKKAIGKLTGL